MQYGVFRVPRAQNGQNGRGDASRRLLRSSLDSALRLALSLPRRCQTSLNNSMSLSAGWASS